MWHNKFSVKGLNATVHVSTVLAQDHFYSGYLRLHVTTLVFTKSTMRKAHCVASDVV